MANRKVWVMEVWIRSGVKEGDDCHKSVIEFNEFPGNVNDAFIHAKEFVKGIFQSEDNFLISDFYEKM